MALIPSQDGFAEAREAGLTYVAPKGATGSPVGGASSAGVTPVEANDSEALQLYNETSVGAIRYSLKAYIGGSFNSGIVMPNQPGFKSVRLVPAVTMRRTLGNRPIRQHSTNRVWQISLGGLTGIQKRKIVKNSAVRDLYGIQALLSIDDFLNNYQKRATASTYSYLRDPRNYNTYVDSSWLVFTDHDEGISYRVEVVDWTWDRDVATTRVYNAKWKLTLVAYERSVVSYSLPSLQAPVQFSVSIDELRANCTPYKENVIQIPMQAKAGTETFILLRSVGGATPPGTTTFDSWIDRADKVTGEVRNRLLTCRRLVLAYRDRAIRLVSFVQDVTDLARMPVGLFAEGVVLLEQLALAYDKVFEIGFGVAADARALSERVYLAYQQTLNALDTSTQVFSGQLGGTPDMLKSVAAVVDQIQPLQVQAPTAVLSEGLTYDYQSALPHLCKEGETWQLISLMYFGTVDNWIDIAAYNKAASGSSDADGVPLQAGKVILVPGAASPGLPGVGNPTSADAMYGTDMQLSDDGDIALNSKTYTYWNGAAFVEVEAPPSDIALVSGRPNLKQALTVRILTPRGQLTNNPSFGLLPMHVGGALTAGALSATIATAVDQIQQDPRVAAVTRMQIDQEASTLRMDMEIQPVAGSPIPASVPLGFT